MANGLRIIKILAIVMQIYAVAGADCKRHPVQVDPTSCCPIPELISKEIMEKCKDFSKLHSSKSREMAGSVDSKISTTPPPTGQPEHETQGFHMPSCFMTCVLNETGLITGMDAKLNEAKLTEYLKVVFNDTADLIPVVETSFKTCSRKVEKFYAEMQKKMQDKMKNGPSTNMSQDRMTPNPSCSPRAGRLMGCVFLKSFKSCPKTVWTNTEECNEMRDHINECIPHLDNSEEDSSSNSNSTEEET